MNKLRLFLGSVIFLVVLQACSSGAAISDQNESVITVITNTYSDSLETITDCSDYQCISHKINEIDNGLYRADPVFLNLNATVMVYLKNYNEAVDTYLELLNILNRHGHNYYAFGSDMPDYLKINNDLSVRNNISEQDINSILNGLRVHVQTGNRMRLLMTLENLTGELPSQPIYEGLNGLALEALDQYFNISIIRPKLVPYNTAPRYSDNITIVALNTVYQNLIISQLLAEDGDGLKNTIKEIQNIPYRYRSSELNFYLTLGLYLIDNPNWRDNNDQLSKLLKKHQ